MNTHPGNIAYAAGLVGAAISIIYTINTVWLHQTGQSLLSTSGSFVSREDMFATVAIGVAVILLSWGTGAAARHFLMKSADKR